ncbi:MAG: hypothetical protein ACLQPD_16425 [Desulfomonilaceae bacterium]
METSESSNYGEINWLNFLQEAPVKGSARDSPQNHQSLTEDPRFLRAVLIAFLSMIDEKCVFSGIEVTRVLDLDFLKGIPDNSEIAFKVVQDYSGRDYLQITVRDQPFPFKMPKNTDLGGLHPSTAP